MKLTEVKEEDYDKLNLSGIEIVPQLDTEKGFLLRDTVSGAYIFVEVPRYGKPKLYGELPLEEVEVIPDVELPEPKPPLTEPL